MDASESVPRTLSLGEHYGFSANPYDPSPLGIGAEDSELFVGRTKEARTLTAFLSSFDRGAIVIEGGIGVGKTSFVNVQQYRGAKELALLTSPSAIELQPGMTPTEFLLSVLSNTLSSLRQAHPRVEREKEFARLARSVEQTLVSTRAYQGALTALGGAGFSLGGGRQVTPTNPNLTLLPTVSKYLDDLSVLAHEFGYDKIVVSVDNLDIVDTRSLIEFLHATRDLTLTRLGYLWIFTGPAGTRAHIAQNAPRVSELMVTDPISVLPLSISEVHEAIAERVKKFRASKETQAPITKEVVDLLYEASNGEFRYILNRCRDLLFRTMIDFPMTKHVSMPLAFPLLNHMTKDALARANLTVKQGKVLERIAENGACQPKDYKKFGFNSSPAFIRYLRDFYSMKLLDRREQGREVVYIPRGDVTLALRSEFIERWRREVAGTKPTPPSKRSSPR